MAPTLLRKGSLVPNDKKEKLDNIVPIDYILSWITSRMATTGIDSRVLVLKSDTGSGKSTVFPAMLFKSITKKGGPGIAVTQPRVLNAVSIVRDQLIAGGYYPYLTLGENIGWLTGPTRLRPKYGLTFMTIGVLVMQLKTLSDAEIMSRYRVIVIDEVHEASLEQAVVLLMLRNFLERNKNNSALPFVVLASATIETELFLDYFGVGVKNLIQVRGFTYPLEEVWSLKTATIDYLRSGLEVCNKIHLSNKDHPDNADILVFLPGMGEILSLQQSLEEQCVKNVKAKHPAFKVLVIDSGAIKNNTQDYADVFAPLDSISITIDSKEYKPVRRIILSTSVAETGVTIDTLKYVVDSGFHRGPEYNPDFDISGVVTRAASKSRVKQRMGRANRKSMGVLYPLYPKYVYDSMQDGQLSDIETSNISTVILDLFYEHTRGRQLITGKTQSVDFTEIQPINKIPLAAMQRNIEKLYILGFLSPDSKFAHVENKTNVALSEFGITQDLDIRYDFRDPNPLPDQMLKQLPTNGNLYSITKLGALASKISRLTPEQIRMIFASFAWGASTLDIISICAWLQFDDIREDRKKPIDWMRIYRDGIPRFFTDKIGDSAGGDLVYRIKLIIADDFINGLMFFNALGQQINMANKEKMLIALRDWCILVNVRYSTMIEMINTREDIINNFLDMSLDIFQGVELLDVIEEDYIAAITRIKYCIYDGMKLNVMRYDFDAGVYKTKNNIPVATPDLFTDIDITCAELKKFGLTLKHKPKYVIYNSLNYKLERDGVFKVVANKVCALDGYVQIDLNMV